MPKIKIHPLFVTLLILLVMTGRILLFVNMIAAVVIHELAHSRIARNRGYVIESMTLMPYGAVLSGKQNIARDDAVAIYMAGPVFNAIVALFIIALWWLVPSLYSLTRLFVVANITLAVFNIIPIYPLDGAKIIMNLCDNRVRALKIMQILGIVISFGMFLIFIVSALRVINFSIGILAVFLFAGAVAGNNREKYHHMTSNVPFVKNYNEGMRNVNITIPDSMPLYRILKFIKPDVINTFTIVDKSRNIIKIIDEKELQSLFENNDISAKIGNIL